MTARLTWVLVAALVVVGCSGPATHTLTGTFTLTADNSSFDVDVTVPTCKGNGGYADFRPGMSVAVKDQSSTIIASGVTVFDHWESGHCRLAFSVANVPDVPFYSIEVGRRGALTYSRDDLASKNWAVVLTLGA